LCVTHFINLFFDLNRKTFYKFIIYAFYENIDSCANAFYKFYKFIIFTQYYLVLQHKSVEDDIWIKKYRLFLLIDKNYYNLLFKTTGHHGMKIRNYKKFKKRIIRGIKKSIINIFFIA
jgi:hypothetical protein